MQEKEPFMLLYDGKPLLSIKANGTIVRGEMFTTDDEASLKFWQILVDIGPQFKEAMFKQYLLDHHMSVFKL